MKKNHCTRRTFLQDVGFGVFGMLLLGPYGRVNASVETRPNFFLVLGDDMTWRDCEPYGNMRVETPNMRRLAREGMCLDAMFTPTAMCAPCRMSLYSGLYPVRSGGYPNHSSVYQGTKSLPHYLSKLGYRTGLIGKKHISPKASFPFEDLGGKAAADTDTTAIAEFVNRQPSQPYCLVVASNQPHKPWDKSLPGITYNPHTLAVPPYLIDCEETRKSLAAYYAEISFLDHVLGTCMQVIDNSGQKENTLLMFCSEQGAQFPFAKWTCYELGLKGAFIARWPGRIPAGSRSAALISYVDLTPILIDAAGGDPDAFDTGCPDAYGNTGFDGRSFLNVLLGNTDVHRRYVYGVQTTRIINDGSRCYPVRSVRSRRFKYIRNLNATSTFHCLGTTSSPMYRRWKELALEGKANVERVRLYEKRPPEELYDIQQDPYELTNLAADSRYISVKQQLRRKLDQWMEQQGDQGLETEMNAASRTNRKEWRSWEEQHQ